MQYLGPLQSLIIGILLIIFRKKCAGFLQRSFEVFPKYEDGVKTFNLKFTVRPIFISILGLLVIVVATFGLISIALSS